MPHAHMSHTHRDPFKSNGKYTTNRWKRVFYVKTCWDQVNNTVDAVLFDGEATHCTILHASKLNFTNIQKKNMYSHFDFVGKLNTWF